ncbi:MAG TPA: nickel pincer cofactor biosynthesis protein LarB, partial [Blastocatellia bacterium]|nr:nickel pincer cofactor biosynthesis protein LarB [Blastocatellia bacterium]
MPGNLVEAYRAGIIATAAPFTGFQPIVPRRGLSNDVTFRAVRFPSSAELSQTDPQPTFYAYAKITVVTRDRVKKLLEDARAGRIDIDEAADQLAHLPYENIEFARVDHHRELRLGFPEVILGQGKTIEQITHIADRILTRSSNLLISRTSEEVFDRIIKLAPEAEFHAEARMISVLRDKTERGVGAIAIISAGTSDIPVAEEAAITAIAMGNKVSRVYDVGVAGIHRLFDARDDFASARVIVVVAGMEGALPSVVGGMVSVPVIAVPTSIGYGASFNGIA